MLETASADKTNIEGRDWRPLYFLTTGGTIWSGHSFPSEAEARAFADAFFTEWQAYQDAGGSELVETPAGTMIPFERFSHAIPMPIGS